jgi:hypothetical protein
MRRKLRGGKDFTASSFGGLCGHVRFGGYTTRWSNDDV